MLNYILLLVGFIMLIKGADVFVNNTSYIAKRFGIPSIVVGLTIVAIGTSAPEFSVSVSSALSGMPDMSIANITGSIIFNLLGVLGLSSLMGNLKINHFKDVIIMILVELILLITSVDGNLNKVDGLVLLIIFIFYTLSLVIKSINTDNNNINEDELKHKSMILVICMGIIGLAAIIWGGNIVVDAASAIASQLGMSENLIGLTVVAIGTSLPELVTSLVATKKGELDIAIGNVIGSNIFNVLLILGSVATICPMTVTAITIVDMIFMIVIFILFILMTFKDRILNRWEGIVLIIVYILYIIFTIIR